MTRLHRCATRVTTPAFSSDVLLSHSFVQKLK
jgi:hypothetical protein